MQGYTRLSDGDIQVIHYGADSGHTPEEIAERLGRDPKTVRYWLDKKHRASPRSPPKRAPRLAKATRARRAIVRRLAAAKVTVRHRTFRPNSGSCVIRDILARDHNIHVHRSTVRRDLVALGFKHRARGKDMAFSEGDITARFAFARKHARRDPTKFVFTDEKTFTCGDYTNNKEWVPKGEKPTRKDRSSNAQESVYVWAAIGQNFRRLVVIRKSHARVRAARRRNLEDKPDKERMTGPNYIKRCLSGAVMNHLIRVKGVLQADGHRAHYAAPVIKYLDEKNVDYTADWPARSPDLNPIENLWAELQKRVSMHVPLNADELEEAIWEEWNKWDYLDVNRYVASFKGKCQTVAKNKGIMTK